MSEAEAPLDFSFFLELAQPPTIEDELELEKEIRIIRATDNIDDVKKYAETIARRNHQQTIFISECLLRMAGLQAKIVKNKDTKKGHKSPNLLKKILKLE